MCYNVKNVSAVFFITVKPNWTGPQQILPYLRIICFSRKNSLENYNFGGCNWVRVYNYMKHSMKKKKIIKVNYLLTKNNNFTTLKWKSQTVCIHLFLVEMNMSAIRLKFTPLLSKFQWSQFARTWIFKIEQPAAKEWFIFWMALINLLF